MEERQAERPDRRDDRYQEGGGRRSPGLSAQSTRPAAARSRLERLAAVRARAEATEYAAALDHLDTHSRDTGVRAPHELAEAVRGAVIAEIAHALGWSSYQANTRLARAWRTRELLSGTWSVFLDGGMDAARMLTAGAAAARLLRPESLTVVDDATVAYAPGHTVRELKDHLDRLVARLEPSTLEQEAEAGFRERRVHIEDRGDGMSELWALIPTLRAAVIDQALSRAGKTRSRRPDAHADADAGVTLAQARADVLTEALTGGAAPTLDGVTAHEREAENRRRVRDGANCLCHDLPTADAPFAQIGDAPMALCPDLDAIAAPGGDGDDRPRRAAVADSAKDADSAKATVAGVGHAGDDEARPLGIGGVSVHIGVLVPAATLAGDSEQPGVSWDGRWTISADRVRELTTGGGPGQVFWHRILTGTGGDVLTHEYAGRFPSETLKAAIAFRDSTCAMPGCMVPVTVGDIDHRDPWPAGTTHGGNLWGLCRRHHRWKTLGVIEPVSLGHDPGAAPPRTEGGTHESSPSAPATTNTSTGSGNGGEPPGAAPPLRGEVPSGWGLRLPGGTILPVNRPAHAPPPRPPIPAARGHAASGTGGAVPAGREPRACPRIDLAAPDDSLIVEIDIAA